MEGLIAKNYFALGSRLGQRSQVKGGAQLVNAKLICQHVEIDDSKMKATRLNGQ